MRAHDAGADEKRREGDDPDASKYSRIHGSCLLEGVGLRHTGAPGQITVVEVKGVKVAVLGFAPYDWAQSLTDLRAPALGAPAPG